MQTLITSSGTVYIKQTTDFIWRDSLGKGAYGTANILEDKITGKVYVGKMAHETDIVADDIVREISTLNILSNRRNIVPLKALIYRTRSVNPVIVLDIMQGNAEKFPPQSHEALRNMMFDICSG